MRGKYQIVIFREGQGVSRSVRIQGWILFCALILIIGVLICNYWLWREYLQDRDLEKNLAESNDIIAEQRRQTMSLAEKINSLSQDLDRVKKFDSKLRLMMNMEKEPADVGEEYSDFSRSYLPLHRQELAARKMQNFLDRLAESARLEEVSQQDILHALRDNRSILAGMPTIWPVNGFVTSSFGGRKSPFGGNSQFHKGLDISNRIGTPVIAPAEGSIILAAPDGAYGNSVEIDHGGGIVTKFAHLQKMAVKNGEWVKRGQVIGYVGMTGRTTGPHLHYEVRLNGAPVNPMRYILE